MEIPNYQPFYLQSLEELRAEIKRLGLRVPADEDLSPLGEPLSISGRLIPNRFCAQPIAGNDAEPDGAPSSLTRRRYTAYSKGEFGLIWVERTSAVDGQEPRGLRLSRDTVPRFAKMLEDMRASATVKPLVIVQLIATSSEAMIASAKFAADAGFDGVDIQGNWNTLPYTLARLGTAVPGLLLTTRLSAYEGVRGGFGVSLNDFRKHDLAGPMTFVRSLLESGLQMLNVTSAGPRLVGTTRGSQPFADFERGDEHPLTTMARQLMLVQTLRETFPNVPMVGSGFSWLRQLTPHIASAAIRSGVMDFAGLGRAALACPNLPSQVLTRGMVEAGSTCMVCFACSHLAESGREVGCVIRDPDVYGHPFRDARRLDADRLLSGAARCHLCEAAPCSAKSPTRTDIPSFIKAFREGRTQDAYEVLRAGNALPEMVSQTGPSWCEAEGACIEKTLGGIQVPIRDLQYAAAWLARDKGISGITIPEASTHKTVAVIGGGSAGISAAARLLELGHRVHIYEASSCLGGVPARLLARHRAMADPSGEIAALLNPALSAGRLECFFNRTLGKDVFLKNLTLVYDAVLVSVGLWRERSLGKADGVIGALDLLEHGLPSTPRRVAVLAGGDSAMDACSALQALGTAEIYVVFEGPRAEMHWHLSDSWFARPGVHAMMSWKPLGYACDVEGKVNGLHLGHSELGIESTLPVDLVVEAMGLTLCDAVRSELESCSGVLHTAGAMVNGGASVGHCVAEGHAAAENIHRQLLK